MPTATADDALTSLNIRQEIEIAAPPEVVFATMLERMGPKNQMPDGTPFTMTVEAWPGGRWFRDLGDNTGHLWGHVQVIKPPKLLEISGPLFMSYPAINFVQYRLEAKGKGTLLSLTHRAFGHLLAEHKEGVKMGWGEMLATFKEWSERR